MACSRKSPKFKRCVEKVSAKGGGNAYAICTTALSKK